MRTNLLTLIITLVVGVILAGSILAPIVSDYGGDTVVHNSLGHRAKLVEDADSTEETHTIRVTYLTPSITIDDVEIEGTEGTWYDLIISDSFALHYQWKENATISVTTFSVSNNKGVIDVLYDVTTFTISGNTTTYNFGNATVTRIMSWYSYYDESGDHVNALMYQGIPVTTVYLKSIEDVRGYTIDSTYNKVYGFIGDTVEADKHAGVEGRELTATYSLGEYSSNSEIKTLSIGRSTGDYTIVDGETTYPFSFVLPYEVTAPNSLKEYSALLTAIPLLLIIGLVITSLGAIYLRRE